MRKNLLSDEIIWLDPSLAPKLIAPFTYLLQQLKSDDEVGEKVKLDNVQISLPHIQIISHIPTST
jgi:hypothetical protein